MLDMQQDLSSVFAALGDPTRLAIIQRLSEGEASVQMLAAPFDISGPAISRHLKILEDVGLISRGREAQFRPCRLERERLMEIRDWTKQMRRFWDESFDRMDDYLEEIMEEKRS